MLKNGHVLGKNFVPTKIETSVATLAIFSCSYLLSRPPLFHFQFSLMNSKILEICKFFLTILNQLQFVKITSQHEIFGSSLA